MGHIRLGRLPKTLRWRGVVGLLSYSPNNVPAVARGTAAAAESRLRSLPDEPSLTHCFWLLTRIVAASRQPNFTTALTSLGLPEPRSDFAVAYISQITDQVRLDLATDTDAGPFTEIASLALRRALSETVGVHGPSLFGSSLDDIHQAFYAHSTPTQFGELAHRFFGDFLARTLSYFVERELSNNVGIGHALSEIEESADFATALDGYARESARIVEEFANGWYGKHNWESGGAISQEEAQGFVAVALRKLRMELRQAEQ